MLWATLFGARRRLGPLGGSWAAPGALLAALGQLLGRLGPLLAAPKAGFVEKLICADSTAFFVLFGALGWLLDRPKWLLGGSGADLSGSWVAFGHSRIVVQSYSRTVVRSYSGTGSEVGSHLSATQPHLETRQPLKLS